MVLYLELCPVCDYADVYLTIITVRYGYYCPLSCNPWFFTVCRRLFVHACGLLRV